MSKDELQIVWEGKSIPYAHDAIFTKVLRPSYNLKVLRIYLDMNPVSHKKYVDGMVRFRVNSLEGDLPEVGDEFLSYKENLAEGSADLHIITFWSKKERKNKECKIAGLMAHSWFSYL